MVIPKKKPRPRAHWERDRELVRACRDGDESAWRELVDRHRRLVYSVARTHGFPRADAEDVFQAVMLLLFQNLGRLRRESSLVGWLSVTTRRECQARLKAEVREQSLDPETAEAVPAEPLDVDAAIDRIGQDHALMLALETLDDVCRDLLTSLYLEVPKPHYREVARRLGRPIGSLGPTRTRCLTKLRRLYASLGGTEL